MGYMTLHPPAKPWSSQWLNSRQNIKSKMALNKLAAIINLASTEELNTAVIQKILTCNNTARVLAAHRQINNTHIIGLIDTHLNQALSPSTNIDANPQPSNNHPTQEVPAPQPHTATHFRHEITGRCLPRTHSFRPGPAPTASPPNTSTTRLIYPETQNINQFNTLPSTQKFCPQTENVTNTGATRPQSEPPSKQTRSRHTASTASPMHSIHTPTQNIVLPSTQNINPGGNDALNIPPGDGSTFSATPPGIQRENPEDGPPIKRTRSTKTQESRNTFQDSNVARTPQGPVSINITIRQRLLKSALRRKKFQEQDL
eukprot:1150474-Pelagomonas_calceolata.AAC.3